MARPIGSGPVIGRSQVQCTTIGRKVIRPPEPGCDPDSALTKSRLRDSFVAERLTLHSDAIGVASGTRQAEMLVTWWASAMEANAALRLPNSAAYF